MNPKRLGVMLLVSLVALSLTSCSDDETITPPGDSVAPFVVGIDPTPDDTGINVDEEIIIVFNEPMDPASAAGNISLSSGTVTTLTWFDNRTLEVDHTPWAEGVEVTVTVGTGLKDVAGNALASAASSRFWIETSVVSLLSTIPADLATDVARNDMVQMLFSQRMNLASVASATIATATIPPSPGLTPDLEPSVPLTFTLDNGEGNWVILAFDSVLPANSEIQIEVGTGAQSEAGTNLDAMSSFKYTTGTDTDTDPPMLVSTSPPNGATISLDQTFIRFTFDEPLNIESFTTSRIGAQFFLLLEQVGDPTWSNNNSVVTVPLPTPLPEGLPILVHFDSYEDVAGNVQTTPIEYELTVSGVADYFPAPDGAQFTFDTHWVERDSTGAIVDEAAGLEYSGISTVSATSFNLVAYEDETFTVDRGWESYTDVGDAIEFTGFTEKDGLNTEAFTFAPPVTFIRLPWTTQFWNGVSEAQSTGGNFDVTYGINVSGPEDIQVRDTAGPLEDGSAYWIDCWKLVLSFELSSGGQVQTGTQSYWFAPTVGIVQQINDEESENGGREESESYLQFLEF